MDILAQLQELLLERSKYIDADRFFIHGQWLIDLLFKPNVHERTFNYQLVVVQTIRQGSCYCFYNTPSVDLNLIGKDARYFSTDNRCLKIAILDSAFSSLNYESVTNFVIDGTASQKALKRAKILTAEAIYQLPDNLKHERPSIVNVGVIGNIIRCLKQSNIDVYATDLDPELINQYFHGVVIQDGFKDTLELIERCDVALITGMTLSTKTLEDILEVAKTSRTRVIMFAETGAWFAQEYCDTFGLDAVVSEPFPFYIFEGRSVLRLHRQSK